MNLRSRIALAGGTVVFGALALTSGVLYPALANQLHGHTNASLVATAEAAPITADRIKEKLSGGAQVQDFPSDVFNFGATVVQIILDPSSPTAGGDLGPLDDLDLAVAEGVANPYFRELEYAGQRYRVYTTLEAGGPPAGKPAVAPQTLIRVGVPVTEETATLHRLAWLLVALTLAGSVAATAAARLAAGRVLQPIRRLTGTVEEVARTQALSTRIPDGGRDEVGRLARSFGAMMAALDRSVRAQRHLVADASHELRTPLTSLTTNLELLAEDGGTADPQAPTLVRAARDQAGELTALVNDLVELSRQGHVELHTEDTRLDLLAERVVRRAAARASGVRFETALAECPVHADPDALERAIANLLDNAIKWSPPGGRIRVEVEAGEVRVSDEGPGIAPADLPHVFDRFYRSPAARALPGSGLGLAIVRQIAETHGGRVAAEPLPRGVTLRLSLPPAPPA